MTGSPPLSVEGVQETTGVPFAVSTAETPSGASGFLAGVALAGLDAIEAPDALNAATVKVYILPFVRPMKTQEVLVSAVAQVSFESEVTR